MKGNPARFLSSLTSPPAPRRAFFVCSLDSENGLLRWFLSAFKGKYYSFKMDTFAKATSTRVSRQGPFPCYPVRRNLCSPPTRLPDPATRTVPHRCGGGRSQTVWRSLKSLWETRTGAINEDKRMRRVTINWDEPRVVARVLNL